MTPNDPLMIDVADVFARLAEEQGRVSVLLAENKATLFDRLTAAGVARVQVEFDGGGDSGQIESIEAQTGDGAPVDLPDGALSLHLLDGPDGAPRYQDQSVRDVIETLAFDCLFQTHIGWENNEGGYGTFLFEVATRGIHLEMNTRVTEVHGSEHRF